LVRQGRAGLSAIGRAASGIAAARRTMPAPARLVYLDHQATTPLDPRVRAAMLAWLDPAGVGNPHSATHRAGWGAAEAIEEAREKVAALIGARPGEIVFTSGATEANNLALLGASRAGGAVVVSAIEHPSVLDCLPELERRGRRTLVLPVDREGLVRLDRVGPLAAGDLVSVMAANNEIGTLQPIGEIAAACRERGAIFHCDAVQALTSQALDVHDLGIDLLSLSGHKLYGPMGIGTLYVREGLALAPQLFGGGQQDGRRPGTLPVALCVGLGEACRIAVLERAADAGRLLVLRERLFDRLKAEACDLRRNGSAEHGLPGCLNITLPGIDAADLLLDLPDLALSTGSACSSGIEGQPSHVLLAIGRSPEEAHASIRFGLGRGTTEDEVDHAAARLGAALRAHRA
ncbi:MAG: cysteine desulfurase family protein, partial [Geminicoccaceae bacterium]